MTKKQRKGRWHPSRKSNQQKMAQNREYEEHFAPLKKDGKIGEVLDITKTNWST